MIRMTDYGKDGLSMKAKSHLDERFYRLLLELQEIDFVLVELSLYLDTHPNDGAALQQFNQFAKKRQHVSLEYERHYGPLLQFGHSYGGSHWRWIEPPWPWQV